MKLADWMNKTGHTPATLRRALGVKGPNTVKRWINGDRIPEQPMIRRIGELTNGEVTEADFANKSPAECATRVWLPGKRFGWAYPWTDHNDLLDACIPVVKAEAREEDGPTPQERRVREIFGGRLQSLGNGLFLLDNRQTDLRRLIAKANGVLIRNGEKPILYPGVDGEKLL